MQNFGLEVTRGEPASKREHEVIAEEEEEEKKNLHFPSTGPFSDRRYNFRFFVTKYIQKGFKKMLVCFFFLFLHAMAERSPGEWVETVLPLDDNSLVLNHDPAVYYTQKYLHLGTLWMIDSKRNHPTIVQGPIFSFAWENLLGAGINVTDASLLKEVRATDYNKCKPQINMRTLVDVAVITSDDRLNVVSFDLTKLCDCSGCNSKTPPTFSVSSPSSLPTGTAQGLKGMSFAAFYSFDYNAYTNIRQGAVFVTYSSLFLFSQPYAEANEKAGGDSEHFHPQPKPYVLVELGMLPTEDIFSLSADEILKTVNRYDSVPVELRLYVAGSFPGSGHIFSAAFDPSTLSVRSSMYLTLPSEPQSVYADRLASNSGESVFFTRNPGLLFHVINGQVSKENVSFAPGETWSQDASSILQHFVTASGFDQPLGAALHIFDGSNHAILEKFASITRPTFFADFACEFSNSDQAIPAVSFMTQKFSGQVLVNVAYWKPFFEWTAKHETHGSKLFSGKSSTSECDVVTCLPCSQVCNDSTSNKSDCQRAPLQGPNEKGCCILQESASATSCDARCFGNMSCYFCSNLNMSVTDCCSDSGHCTVYPQCR